MTFVLKPMRHEDLDLIYTSERSDEVFKVIQEKKEWWPEDMHAKSWAVDGERRAFLLQLPRNREDSYWRYLFGVSEGILLLEKESYCRFRVEYATPSLRKKSNEIRILVADAFRVSGEFLDGTVDINDPMAVPNAELLDF